MSIEQLKVLVTREFPFPVAYHFRRSLEEKDAHETSCHLLLSLLEFLGSVLICDYLSGDTRSADIDAEVARIQDGLLTAGRWQGLSYRILEAFARTERLPLVPGLERLLSHRAQRELGRLIEARNDWAHRKAHFPLTSFRRRLVNLLDRIQPLHRTALLFLHSSRLAGSLNFHQATLFKGDNPNFAAVECRSDGPLEAERLYLYSKDSRELLCLHPLMTYARCPHCPASHLFLFNKADHRKLIYAALPDGHELVSREAFHDLERILSVTRARRCRPRHFSLPGEFAGIPRTLQPGSRIGPYRVEAVIKNAGTSHVYQAVDSRDGKSYALKVLPVEIACDPVLLQRFDEEAAHLERLDHPHVVKLHDRGEDFGDRYLVLDLVPGGRIGSRTCRDLSEAAKPLIDEDIIRIGKQVCEALDCIHSRGILHRDLKPGNLLVAGDRVLLGDFGISRSRASTGLTLTGMAVGTPEYMAPEQTQEAETDVRSDLYSLGCVLYELATGRPPYRAESPLATMFCHLQAAPPDILSLNPRISPGLANIILKLLQKNPEQRYASARDLFPDLGRAAADPAGPQVIQGDKTPQDQELELLAKERFRYRRRLVLTGGAAALGLVFLGLVVLGQAFYRDWEVRSDVTKARSTWSDGRRQQALDLLQEGAHRRDRDHAAVQGLLSEFASFGALTIHTDPGGLWMEAVPDTRSAAEVGFPAAAGPPPGRSRRFRSGERIQLGIGHYRVSIFQSGEAEPWATALFFIGQERYRRDANGWKPEHLPRAASELVQRSEETSTSFILGEEVTVERLILPGRFAPHQVYVNPGPFWRSPGIGQLPQGQRLADGFEVYEPSPRMVRDELHQGFLIARDETTIADFGKWFRRRGRDFADWRVGVDSRMPLARIDVRKVPLHIQKECWDPILKARGIEVNCLQTPDALLEAAFGPTLRKDHEEHWAGWVKGWDDALAQEPDGMLPVAVEMVPALAYARTHTEIGREAFLRWLRRKEEEARAAEHGLERAKGALEAAGGELVHADLLPTDPLVRCRPGFGPEFSRQPILLAYGWWFHSGARYACQIPSRSIIHWARRNPDLRELPLWSQIDRIEKVLETPSRWLGNRSKLEDRPDRAGEVDEASLVDAYGEAVRKGRVDLDRAHVLEWIDDRIGEEREARRMLEELRERLSGPLDLAEAELRELRFELRYEFGADQGWNIPSAVQWEKACRGPDGRPYPHGDLREASDAASIAEYGWVGRGIPLTVNQARLTASRDRSPYDVFGLAGNFSEWVHEEGHFLKGGNFSAEGSRIAHAGWFFGLTARRRMPWSGFRVVREIRCLEESP